MAHFIAALVMPKDNLDKVKEYFGEPKGVVVSNGFVVVPYRRGPSGAESSMEFVKFSANIKENIRAASKHGPIAYIETEYFGGIGRQAAFAFERGQELMPPTLNKIDAVNQALRAICVSADGYLDEFSAVGLDQLRKNADFGS